MASDITERNLLHLEAGLAVGDFCLVEATQNLYVCTAAPTGLDSTWQPIAGLPTWGHYALSGKNHGAANATVFQRQAFTFRAVLDVVPGLILVSFSSVDWNATTVQLLTTFGFSIEGRSVAIAPGNEAYVDGLYFIF